MKPRMFRILLAVLVALFSCPPWGAAGTSTTQADAVQVRTGRYRGDITDHATGEVIMQVAMQVPQKLPAERHLGLLLLFHGFRGNENNYIGLTVDALKRLRLLDDYVVISGKSKGPGWTAEDDAPVLRLIRWAKETYPIDPRRLFIFGSSNGAVYVGRFGSAHEDQRIREAAFASLEKNVPDTFGYKPDLPQPARKAAVEQWKKWCQEKCGPAPELPH